MFKAINTDDNNVYTLNNRKSSLISEIYWRFFANFALRLRTKTFIV